MSAAVHDLNAYRTRFDRVIASRVADALVELGGEAHRDAIVARVSFNAGLSPARADDAAALAGDVERALLDNEIVNPEGAKLFLRAYGATSLRWTLAPAALDAPLAATWARRQLEG